MRHILYLQTEVHNYHLPLLRKLSNEFKVDVVHWEKDPNSPFEAPIISNVNFISKSSFSSFADLKKFIDSKTYSIVRVAGWMDRDYLRLCGYLRKTSVKIIVCSDTQYKGTLRQRLGIIFFRFVLLRLFSNIFVSGPFQYEYAKRLGFSNNEILFGNLCADSDTFNNKKYKREKTILFVGRLVDIKGVHQLIKAWNDISDKQGWTLKLIGDGPLKKIIKNTPSTILVGYSSPSLISEEMNKASFVVIPSKVEPWGVVVHEAVSSGSPIISRKTVGANSVFLINNYSGYAYCKDDELKNVLLKSINTSITDWEKMNKNCFEIANRITLESSYASFISVL